MSQQHFHAVIWIDHREARVFHFGPEDVETLVLRPDHPSRNIHHKSNTIGSGHDVLAPEFLRAGAQSIAKVEFYSRPSGGTAETDKLRSSRARGSLESPGVARASAALRIPETS